VQNGIKALRAGISLEDTHVYWSCVINCCRYSHQDQKVLQAQHVDLLNA
jgi:hypothetical protein